MSRVTWIRIIFFFASCIVANTFAETALRDPTKPLPGFVKQPTTVGDSGEGIEGGAGAYPGDHFGQSESNPPQGGGWTLYKIIVSDTRRIANVNGQSLRIGDTFDGYIVTQIESSYVILENEVEQKTLSFSNDQIKVIRDSGESL